MKMYLKALSNDKNFYAGSIPCAFAYAESEMELETFFSNVVR